VTIFHAVQLLAPTSRGPRVFGIRASVSRGLRRINSERSAAAKKTLQRIARELNRRGWRTRIVLTTGEPLRDLMDTVGKAKADLVIVGARGTRMVRHLLLGSVAEGALNLSPVPVLLTR
jgi:nucleotide-binding universal stress UspA family protein